jgi:hypothetical protein
MIDHEKLRQEQLARADRMRRDPERAESFDPGDARVQQTDNIDIEIEPGTWVRTSLAQRKGRA